MAIDFTDLDAATLEDLSSLIKPADDTVKASRSYFDGDHFQNGLGYIGPTRNSDQGHVDDTFTKQIQKVFISANKIKEVVKRQQGAVVGREMNYAYVLRRPLKDVRGTDGETTKEEPTTQEQETLDEANRVIVEWFRKRRVLRTVQKGVDRLAVEGRAVFRLFIPRTAFELVKVGDAPEELRVKPAASLEEAMGRIYLNLLSNDTAAVHTDEDTMAQVSISTYQVDEKRVIEVSYVGEDGQTVHKIIAEGGAAPTSNTYPLNGHLVMYQMEDEPLITDQVKQNQALFNTACTMGLRNVVTAGFRERIALNAKFPGRSVPNEAGRDTFLPDAFSVGPSTLHNLQGMTYQDADGKTHVATPDYKIFDPVQVAHFTETMRTAYFNILSEVDQKHVEISEASTPTGESRKQARDDFKRRLNTPKAEVEGLVTWILEGALAWAAYIVDQPEKYSIVRATVECKLDLGMPSAEELKVAIELVNAKFWSMLRGRLFANVDDPDAEEAQIAEERPEDSINQERAALALDTDRRFRDAITSNSGQEGDPDPAPNTNPAPPPAVS